MIHNCLLLKPLRITLIRRKELHNEFNSPVCSQNTCESGQNHPGSQNIQVLNVLFSRPFKGVFTEFNVLLIHSLLEEKEGGNHVKVSFLLRRQKRE